MFQGQAIEIPLGQAGLSGNRNHADLTPAHLVNAQNVSYWTGLIRRESGATLFTPTPLAGAISSGITWLGGTRSAVTVGSELRKDTGSGTFPTVLASGLLPYDLLPNYAKGGEEAPGQPELLFCALSPNPPRVVVGDADTAPLLSTLQPGTPVEWAAGPAAFVQHEGRMWGIGAGADPHRVHYSSPTAHLNFTAAGGGGQMLVYPGEGERIVAGMSFKGLLLLWKFPTGIYAIDTSEVDPVNWRVRRISAYVGTRGPGCVTQLESDVIFMDAQGSVQLLSGITEYGQVGTANLTDAYDLGGRIRGEFRPDRFAFSSVQFCPTRREIHITLCQRGQTAENTRLVVDMNRAGQYRFRIVTRDLCSALWLKGDSEHTLRPMVGGSDGRIWMLDQVGVERIAGSVVDDPAVSVAMTPDMDFGAPTQRKNGKFLEVYLGRDAPSWFTVEVYWDGTLRHTITFSMDETGWPLGDVPNPFVLDTSWLAGGGIDLVRRKRLLGSGRRLQLRVLSHSAGHDFLISRLYVSVAAANEREPTQRGTTGVGVGASPSGASARGGRR